MSAMTPTDRLQLADDAYQALGQFTERSDRPTLTVVLGQTGSPIEAVSADIEERMLPRGGAVQVGAADMERVAAGAEVDVDDAQANQLATDVAARAIGEKRNVIFAPSPSLEDGALSVIADARRAGYRIEVAALAVSPQLSAAQAFQRGLVPDAGRVPRTDRQLEHEATTVAKALRRIEANGVADSITVYDRAGRAVENTHGDLSHSDVFSRQRGQLSGADRINLAAAWEEVAEAHERAGEELSDVATRLRQQAHYLVRQDEGVALNFDDRYPEYALTSRELAEEYGQELGRLFDAKDTRAVATHPELTNAFVAQRVATLLSQEQRTPEILAAAERRIHGSLVDGRSIRVPEMRDQQVRQTEQSFSAIER